MPQQPRRLNPEASPLALFGARLRAYRNQHGWVQAELGRAVHVSGTLIAKLEKGTSVTFQLRRGQQQFFSTVRLSNGSTE
jgi:DNA-binding XRE family transcriptional regulator